jgi:hypothetical protein
VWARKIGASQLRSKLKKDVAALNNAQTTLKDAVNSTVELRGEIGACAPLRPFVTREMMQGNLKGAALENVIRNGLCVAGTNRQRQGLFTGSRAVLLLALGKRVDGVSVRLESEPSCVSPGHKVERPHEHCDRGQSRFVQRRFVS